MVSSRLKLVTVLGRLLVTTTVLESKVPGICGVLLSSLITDRSACGVSVSVSLAVLLAELVSIGALIVALLVIEPVFAGSIVPLSVLPFPTRRSSDLPVHAPVVEL